MTAGHRELIAASHRQRAVLGLPGGMMGKRHTLASRAKIAAARRAFYAQLTQDERNALGIKLRAGKRKDIGA